MQELLEKLYSYEYFGIYLMVAIAVLILLFIVVLFFGKKDKKVREIEATKKLQLEQANIDAFKEENNTSSVEVPTPVENSISISEVESMPNETVSVSTDSTASNIESDTLVFPTINTEEDNNEPEDTKADLNMEPIQEFDLQSNDTTINDMVASMAKFSEQEENTSISMDIVENNDLENTPILDKVEEKPFVFASDTEDEVKPNEVLSNVEVPEFNFDILNNSEPVKEEAKEPARNIDVFSSVFAPKKEEDMPNIDLSEINKTEVKPEEREEVSVPTIDEMEFELPSLKKEVAEEQSNEEIEKPILKDYNLDDIAGETYDIK